VIYEENFGYRRTGEHVDEFLEQIRDGISIDVQEHILDRAKYRAVGGSAKSEKTMCAVSKGSASPREEVVYDNLFENVMASRGDPFSGDQTSR
jgi:hypothetical protein